MPSRISTVLLPLRDTKSLAKLAAGDMVDIDVMYHLSCLTKLRNRLRDHNTGLKKDVTIASLDALVFGELVCCIEKIRQNVVIVTIVKLSQLVKMYTNRLKELDPHGAEGGRVHSTSLKDRLLRQIPDLRAEQNGSEVLLIFQKDVGGVIKQALKNDMDTDAIHLVRAAQVVRKDIFDQTYEFSRSFGQDCERKAVPPSLNALVRMILEGPNIENQSTINATKEHISVVLSELLVFNAVKRSRASAIIRHNKARETPLPIYPSMLIHAKTRKRELIDTLFNLGLCLLYDRLMSISTDLANNVCSQYHAEMVVCPLQLRSSVFTGGAFDNLDHNPTVRTALDAFHGTGISLIQFPNCESQGNGRRKRHVQLDNGAQHNHEVANRKNIAPLPVDYTIVPPISDKSPDTVVHVKVGDFVTDSTVVSHDMAKEQNWLVRMQTLLNKEKLQIDDYISWAAYHASTQPPPNKPSSTVALLPLLREKANTMCMVSHAMKMIIKAVNHLNPGQTTLVVADQPLYAIAKKVQWVWPATLKDEKMCGHDGRLAHRDESPKATRRLAQGNWLDYSIVTS